MGLKGKAKEILGLMRAKIFWCNCWTECLYWQALQLKRKTSYYLGRFRNGTSLYPNLVGGGTVRIGKGSEIGERCRISIANSLILRESTPLAKCVHN